jgi:hypothetical protein
VRFLKKTDATLIEITARLVAKTDPKCLGNMAKAFHPRWVDGLQPDGGEQQVPCVTTRPSRASEHLQEEFSGRPPRTASKELVTPGAGNRGFAVVHVLFYCMVALGLCTSVPCFVTGPQIEWDGHIEITARLVAKTDPKCLGNMAKAFHPRWVDGLLCTAGHGV